jgi:DNA-directed RNA polymerase subunit beta'
MNPRRSSRPSGIALPEWPLTYRTPSPSACLGLFLATRDEPNSNAHAKPFRNRERVIEAIDCGFLRKSDTVRVAGRSTTAGRYLVAECLVPALWDEVVRAPCTAKSIESWLSLVMRDEHAEVAARCSEALELLGRRFVEGSGASLAMDHFGAPPEAASAVAEGLSYTREVLEQVEEGLITHGERYVKTIDQWSFVRDRCKRAAEGDRTEEPLVAFAAATLAREAAEEGRVLLGMVARRSGELFESPIAHSYGEGLSSHEYAMLCRSERGKRLNQDERNQIADTLLCDLHAVLSETVIGSCDCGTGEGYRMHRSDIGTFATFQSRLEGRITAEEVLSPTGETLALAKIPITRALAQRIEDAGVPSVLVRDPLDCLEFPSVCAMCFGLDPTDFTWPAHEDPMGARAAVTIGQEARNFGLRGFHIC